MDLETLTKLAKGKLNITWSDEGTDARLEAILEDAIPAVANMVGLIYDPPSETVTDGAGNEFDFAKPSIERNLLLNYSAYEWNHKADEFRAAYWQEIAACRQYHAMESADDEEADEDGSE